MRRFRHLSLYDPQLIPRSREIFCVSSRNASLGSCAAVTTACSTYPDSLSPVRAWIQLERTAPQLVCLAAVVSFVRDVAELEVDVIAELRRELDGALVQGPRLIVARAAIGEVAEILG